MRRDGANTRRQRRSRPRCRWFEAAVSSRTGAASGVNQPREHAWPPPAPAPAGRSRCVRSPSARTSARGCSAIPSSPTRRWAAARDHRVRRPRSRAARRAIMPSPDHGRACGRSRAAHRRPSTRCSRAPAGTHRARAARITAGLDPSSATSSRSWAHSRCRRRSNCSSEQEERRSTIAISSDPEDAPSALQATKLSASACTWTTFGRT